MKSSRTTTAIDTPVSERNFVDDRHADQSISEFISLTTDLVIDGFDLSAPLRLPFYLNCLRSDNYRRAAHHYSVGVLAAASTGIRLSGTGWISVREGNSPREMDITMPVNQALREAGMPTGWAFPDNGSRVGRLWSGLFSTFLTGEVRRFFSGYSKKIDSIARRLAASFNFHNSFIEWFKIGVLSNFIQHKRALRLIRGNRESISGLVVYMEYHRLTSALLHAAKENEIPVVLTQHGFLGQEWLHTPLRSDRICVWGEVDRRWYEGRGIRDDRLRVTGTHLAFSIKSEYRRETRSKYNLDPEEYALVYLVPNSLDYFHHKSIGLLKELRAAVTDLSCRWFVRLHRSNKPHVIKMYLEAGFTEFPDDVPVEEAFALADVVIHDYSTMATAEYAGLVTLCLPADPPYPGFYPELLGDQRIIDNPRQFRDIVATISPGYKLDPKSTVTMAAGEDKALTHICDVVRELDRHRC